MSASESVAFTAQFDIISVITLVYAFSLCLIRAAAGPQNAHCDPTGLFISGFFDRALLLLCDVLFFAKADMWGQI